MKRREFLKSVAASGVAATVIPAAFAAPQDQQTPRLFEQKNSGRTRPEVGMLLYPGLTLMDLIAPQTALANSMNVHLVWKSKDVLHSDNGTGIAPTTTFAECTKDLDVVFVPGGPGQIAVMQDAETLRFLADRGSRAKYVTSVCSGSLVLGAAGLLKGYKATSHWAAIDMLPLFGASPVKQRVVMDRNRVTGGGVTAGLDFGLFLLETMLGDQVAKMTQLAMEYDPQPPFDCGSPEKAGPELTQAIRTQLKPFSAKMRATAAAAAKAMPSYIG